MMRSLYSGVSGLKTHQTKMDVIGNNIANVNTEAFKASTVTFQEIMYQTTSGATSGNGATGVGGKNAKQIGLGVSTGSTTISIESAGAAETTGNPFDLRLSDAQSTNFFIVSDGTNTMFTRAGSFYVDGNGFLCMSSTGYTLQGWTVDETTGDIRKDIVQPLQVMSPENQTSAPEATTLGYMSGVLDKNDTNLTGSGYVLTLGIFDDLGYSYTAKFSVTPVYDDTTKVAIDGQYIITLADIINSESKSIIYDSDGNIMNDANGNPIDVNELFGAQIPVLDGNGDPVLDPVTGEPTYDIKMFDMDGDGTDDTAGYIITYDKNKGTFVNVGDQGVDTDAVDTNKNITLNLSKLLTAFTTTDGVATDVKSNFADISVDMSRTMNYDNGGASTMKALKGTTTGDGAGKKLGALTGLSVDANGKIYGSYDNGNTVLLCQIAAAQFANASGLEKVGENCYKTTLNSGDFDGIGVDISADGSSISTGELEMSNVDLSGEFTSMIITQRGFQANSRVITTSDTLLEELINLKR